MRLVSAPTTGPRPLHSPSPSRYFRRVSEPPAAVRAHSRQHSAPQELFHPPFCKASITSAKVVTNPSSSIAAGESQPQLTKGSVGLLSSGERSGSLGQQIVLHPHSREVRQRRKRREKDLPAPSNTQVTSNRSSTHIHHQLGDDQL